MIIERVVEYVIDPDDVAAAFHDDYQGFIQKNDNEDTWDFVVFLVDRLGIDQVLDELDNVQADIVSERFF